MATEVANSSAADKPADAPKADMH
jgi:hypothetical protein